MKCPRCGKPLPPGASFCMFCGQQMAAKRVEVPGARMQPAYPAPGYVPAPASQNRWLWPAVIAAVLLLAALGGAAYLLSSGKPAAVPLTARATPGPVPLTVGRPTMPQDIYDWLDHLRQTEDKKNALSKDQSSKMMFEFTKLNGLGLAYGSVDKEGNLDPDKLESPTQSLGEKIGDLREPWRDLIKFFESVPPPAECTDLAHTYDQALDEVSGEMGDLGDALGGNSNGTPADPQEMIAKLTKLQGQSTGTIDKYFSVSDDMVASLCNKYNTSKWFKIEADSGTPLSSGMGGLTPPPVKTDSIQ